MSNHILQQVIEHLPLNPKQEKRIMIRREARKKWGKRIKTIRKVTKRDRDANGRYARSRTFRDKFSHERDPPYVFGTNENPDNSTS
ncbi:1946_t:CDS:2 [Funneliformis geosporum]|nr:1946_t:CDS:2 [Funneliformis geosporum]